MIRFQQIPDKDDEFRLATISMELPDEVDFDTLVTYFAEFCMSLGYNPATINEALGEE